MELRFLGVGDASQKDLGHAAASVGCGHQRLLIDCGPGILQRFIEHYDALPDALFITHCHLDHVADMESLFIKSWFSGGHRPRVFVPAPIVELLHQRVSSYPQPLAEGDVNFWEAFQLIPVLSSFEFAGHRFLVREVRHHKPGTAFSLHLPECFFYSGDTRPIPEILNTLVGEKETIFHDCSVVGNPSHSGIDDLQREYSQTLRKRIHCYHYNSPSEQQYFSDAGLKYLVPGQSFTFE